MIEYDNSIIRKCDIRGIFNKTLFPKTAYLVGCGLAKYLMSKSLNGKIIVGHDYRRQSEELASQLIKGICDFGFDVVFLSFATTPLVSASSKQKGNIAGVTVTASHNAADNNGFKIIVDNVFLMDEDLKKMLDLGTENNVVNMQSVGKIIDQEVKHLKDEYFSQIQSFIKKPQKTLKVVWDCGYGGVSSVIEDIENLFPEHKHIVINKNKKGEFFDLCEQTDTSIPESSTLLRQEIINNEADIGFLFDGDGDRLVVFDKQGKNLPISELVKLFTDIFNISEPSKVITDIKFSISTLDCFNSKGFECKIVPSGHAVIKKKIIEEDFVFGVEQSSHFFYKNFYDGLDDGLFFASCLLSHIGSDGNITSVENKKNDFKPFSLQKVFLSRSVGINVIKNFLDIVESLNFESVITIDGVRVSSKDFWFLVRPSNTEDCIVYLGEFRTRNGLRKLRSVEKVLNKFISLFSELEKI